MTREAFDRSYILLDRINKVKAVKEKIKNEFPDFAYNPESKLIGDAIFNVLDGMMKQDQKEFDEL